MDQPRHYAADDRIVVTADASEHQGSQGTIVLGNASDAIVRLDKGITVVVSNDGMARIGR